MKINSHAVVINQCDIESIERIQYKQYQILWVNTRERGLSRSRNMALSYASKDICLLCDDDEVLLENYKEIITDAYKETKDADVIAFNINRIGWNENESLFDRKRKIPIHKTYSSVHLTFRRKSVAEANIQFNTDFGAGSNKYLCAEDALFCVACHKKRFHMYTYPAIIADVYCDSSSWFDGYNDHYFYDTGAFLAAAYPKVNRLIKWYYPFRCRKISSLSFGTIISRLNDGIKGYKLNKSFEEYIKQ
jgi:glycosyltransferase involved in cell wall biosynthesis